MWGATSEPWLLNITPEWLGEGKIWVSYLPIQNYPSLESNHGNWWWLKLCGQSCHAKQQSEPKFTVRSEKSKLYSQQGESKVKRNSERIWKKQGFGPEYRFSELQYCAKGNKAFLSAKT